MMFPRIARSAILPPRRSAGSALVSTLLVLLVLTIIVVAFLQSMTVERQTARSYLNRFSAELAATSGANEAIDLLLRSDAECLVNAYAEELVAYNDASFTAPYLTTLKLNPDATEIAETRFLCSSIDDTQTGVAFWRSPANASLQADVETTDINATTPAFPEGFIGLADATGGRRTVPVPWRELLKNPTKARDDDRNSPDYNPVVGRYAYWIDDESAKVSLPVAGGVEPDNTHLRRAGSKPSEVAIHPILAENPAAAASDVASYISQRDGNDNLSKAVPALPASTFRHLSTGLDSDELWRTRRAFVTSWSEADERGPVGGVPNVLGVRRLNLNKFVEQATDYRTTAGRQEIATNVVALGDYIKSVTPEFGDRAADGRTSIPGSSIDTRRRYCVQIAANIQDYIDEDSQPTVVRQNLDSPQWEEPPEVGGVGEGAPTQPPAAFGKENVPSVTEYVGYFYSDGGGLRVDHTFEILNLYTKDITLDPGKWGTVRIFLSQRPDITPNGSSSAPSPDLEDPLVLPIPSGTVLPAGRYSLLTTVPVGSGFRTDNFVAVGGDWTTINWINLNRVENPFAYGDGGLRMDGDQLATAADADTEIVIANEYGYLDIQARVAQQGAVTFSASGTARRVASQPFGNDGSSAGNNVVRKYPLDSGDPRSATDVFPSYSEATGSASVLAWRRNTANSANATKLGGDSHAGTYGFRPNNAVGADTATYVPEPLFGTGNTRASAVIRDGEMASIGELGLIYDPALPSADIPGNATWPRGGFRTLSIGTRYGEIDSAVGNSFAVLEATSDSEDGVKRRAYRLMDIFDVSDDKRGRILLNSALRDPRNVPLRSVFYNLKTQSNTATEIESAEYSDFAGPADPGFTENSPVSVDNLINTLATEAKPEKTGPLLSIGALSDLDIFNEGTDLIGVSLTPDDRNSQLYDRGREEILRNSFQLLTLKGTVFTVYVVAQAGDTINNTFVPRATVRLARTVKLTRSYPADPLATITAEDLKTNNTPTTNEPKVTQLFSEFY